MKSFFKKLYSNVFFNMIGAILLLLLVSGLIVSIIGYMTFTNSFKREYDVSTFHMADTATTLLNGDHIDDYLKGRYPYEYRDVRTSLDKYCQKIAVSLVYVIKVDTSDYGHFVSVFNCVNNEVGNTNYTPWDLGYERETTNDEYRQKYKAIYDGEVEWEKVYRLKDLRGAIPHITTMVPVKNSSGNVVAILCMQRPISELNASRRPFLVKIAICTLLLALFSSASYAGFIKRELAAPLRRVSNEATRFADERSKGDSLNDISRFDDFKNLADSIETMETDMLSYMDNLTQVTAEKERIGLELKLASTIQENSIPNTFPAFPERKDFDVYASMDPAKEVGGDFYNFFLIDDDHLALVIGDVSGKGVPAALFMMVSNIILRDRAQSGGTPGEILTYVNSELCRNNVAEMFVTIWIGIVDLKTGKMTAANAGHEFPAVMRAGGQFELFKDKHGFVVGGMDGIRYKEYELELRPGDRIFVYTDGVPEATDANEQLFGTDRMIAALNKDPAAKPEDILHNVTEAVNGFVKEAEQFDDLTMLCFEYKGPEREMKMEKFIEVEATDANLFEVQCFIEEQLEALECPMKMMTQISIAVEEIYINIAHYAYGEGTGNAVVRVATENDPKSIAITFEDSGMYYDPLAKEDPDVTLSAKDRPIGGLGIFMTKKIMDDVRYEYRDGKNILTLIKNL